MRTANATTIGITAGAVAQPDRWPTLQPLVSIIDTVLVPEMR